MAVKKVSPSTADEIRAILGRDRAAVLEMDDRLILLQAVEAEFDLDGFLEEHPEAMAQLEAGMRDMDTGDYVSHEAVERSIRKN